MASRPIVIRDPRDTQPQDGSHLVFNPRLPRPVFATIGGVPRLDLISGKFATQGSGDSYGASQQGPAFKGGRVAAGGLTYPASLRPITSDNWTIIALANPGSADGVSTLFSQRTSISPYSQINFFANMGSGFVARAGCFALVCATSEAAGTSDYPSAQSTSTALVDGKLHVYAARRGGRSSYIDLWYDGAQPTITQTGPLVSTLSSNQLTRVGNIGDYAADGTYAAACSIPFVVIYDRALSDADMKRLGQRPWAAFADAERRVWVPVAASTTLVTGSQASGWSVSSYAAGTAPGAWSVSNAAAASRAGAWSVSNYSSAAQAGSWSVSNLAAGSGSGAWSIGTAVGASQSGAWSVNATASSVQAGAWSVSGYVGATQAGAWSVYVAAAASQPGAWSVSNAVGGSQPGAWSVYGYAGTAQAVLLQKLRIVLFQLAVGSGRDGVCRVIAGDDAEHGCCIRHGACQRAAYVCREEQRHDAIAAGEADRRTDAHEVIVRGRPAD